MKKIFFFSNSFFIIFNSSPNNCSNRGKCVGHQCVCTGDWIAKDCSIHACPDGCGATENRGMCLREHCRCANVSSISAIFSLS